MSKSPTLFERAAKRGQVSIGLDGQPIGCIVRVYGSSFQPAYCKIAGSELRCKDCWARTYHDAHKEARSRKADGAASFGLIAGKYTLADLTVRNGKAASR